MVYDLYLQLMDRNEKMNWVLSSTAYENLKWTVSIVLPAISAAYFGLASIWHLPYAEEVVGTFAVIATFGGALLGISTSRYNNQQNLDSQE